jgi:hypothetical protein
MKHQHYRNRCDHNDRTDNSHDQAVSAHTRTRPSVPTCFARRAVFAALTH